MNRSRFSRLYRILFFLLLLAVLGLVVPGQVQAAAPFLAIVTIKAGEMVTVHASGLPAGMSFDARMDKATTAASSGTLVGTTTSAADGTFDATYAIPATLKTELAIAIRIDSTTGGWYAYNWFTNLTRTAGPTSTTTPTASPSTTSANIYIEIIAVEKNTRLTVRATNFPADIDFKVRIGPFYTFGYDQQVVATINSGKGGSFLFNVNLPAIARDVSLVTIRMDAVTGRQPFVAYNAFSNENKGMVVSQPTVTPTPSSTPTSTPTPTPIIQTNCQILSVAPTLSMPINQDFDAIWEVKNTSTKTWDNHEIDFRYQSGDKFYKITSLYDLPMLVKPGETVTLVADMLSPNQTGSYSIVFILVGGGQGIVCSLPLTITVK